MVELISPKAEEYAVAHTSPEPAYFAALAAETNASTERPTMMVGTLEGRFLAMLVGLLLPRQVLEIGTFTGYSALSMAEGLPPDGRIITCELDPKHAAIARRHFDASPYGDRIEIRQGPALETLKSLEGPFEFVFIDADKENYPNYLQAVLPLLAPGGVIAADNTLRSGRVWDKRDKTPDTMGMREFNDAVVADPGLESVMLTVRDGVTLIRRRPR